MLCVLEQPIVDNYSAGLVGSIWLTAGPDYKITFSIYINRQTSSESAALRRLISINGIARVLPNDNYIISFFLEKQLNASDEK